MMEEIDALKREMAEQESLFNQQIFNLDKKKRE